MDYRDYNDYELISYVCENNEEASDIIFRKYEPFITKTVNKYAKCCKINGIDINDLKQEGLMALNRAIYNFDEQKNTTFYMYAKACIERGITNFLCKSMRKKNKILSCSISIDFEDDDKYKLDRILCDKTSNPEKIIITEDYINSLIKKIKKILTDYECQVFNFKLAGFSSSEISEILEINRRKIDNTLHRVRIKAKKIIENSN